MTIKYHLKARVREFLIPLVRDCLVVGVAAPIGCQALARCMDLCVTAGFEHIPVGDEVVQDILVRSALLRKIPREQLVSFVLRNVKPIMTPGEVLQVEFEPEVQMEDTFP